MSHRTREALWLLALVGLSAGFVGMMVSGMIRAAHRGSWWFLPPEALAAGYTLYVAARVLPKAIERVRSA